MHARKNADMQPDTRPKCIHAQAFPPPPLPLALQGQCTLAISCTRSSCCHPLIALITLNLQRVPEHTPERICPCLKPSHCLQGLCVLTTLTRLEELAVLPAGLRVTQEGAASLCAALTGLSRLELGVAHSGQASVLKGALACAGGCVRRLPLPAPARVRVRAVWYPVPLVGVCANLHMCDHEHRMMQVRACACVHTCWGEWPCQHTCVFV